MVVCTINGETHGMYERTNPAHGFPHAPFRALYTKKYAHCFLSNEMPDVWCGPMTCAEKKRKMNIYTVYGHTNLFIQRTTFKNTVESESG